MICVAVVVVVSLVRRVTIERCPYLIKKKCRNNKNIFDLILRRIDFVQDLQFKKCFVSFIDLKISVFEMDAQS